MGVASKVSTTCISSISRLVPAQILLAIVRCMYTPFCSCTATTETSDRALLVDIVELCVILIIS